MSPRGESNDASALKALPSVDRVLRLSAVDDLCRAHGHAFIASAVKGVLADWREGLLRGELAPDQVQEAMLVDALRTRIEARLAPSLQPVFNLTGTVLHTNLGRALLCDDAVAAVVRTASVPVNLEFDVETGDRGDRDSLVEGLLCEITGAEAATVVNNNAAAVLLTIAALSGRREAVISRGELVEIGGAFRMPDVMRCAGAKMVEVGTTNRTHARDYATAITARTGLILKVHTSNYVVQGFTSAVAEAELARIAHDAKLPFAIDLGSGSLVDLATHGLPREPMVQEALASGADVVTFSGDKLLGGPQAGLIVGKADWIKRIRKHPLKRALRVSKLTLAALEATLALYRHPERLRDTLPTLRLLTRKREDIQAQAERLREPLASALAHRFDVTSGPMSSQVGSGALPVDSLPSAGLFVRSRKDRKGAGRDLKGLAKAFRALPIPVIGRISEDALVLDLRTLDDEDAFAAQLPQLADGARP